MTAFFSVHGQNLKGKKLLKESTLLVEQGKQREAISLLAKNFSKEDKNYDLVGLELAEHLINVKLLDSANYFLSVAETHEKTKIGEELASQRRVLDAEIEKYKMEVLLAWKEFDQDDFTKANEHFSKSLTFDIGNYEAYLGLAEIQFRGGANVEAINGLKESLTKYCANSQDKAHIYEHLAEVYLTQRNSLAAIKACNTGMEIDADNFSFFYFKGKGLYYQRLFMEADNLFANYLRFKPESSETWFLRGDCYYNVREFENAILNLNKSLSIDSLNTDAFNIRGRSYFELKKYELAVADFSYLNQLYEGNFYAINALGVCEYYAGDYSSSVMHFEESLALNPTDYNTFNIINAYTKNGQNNKALALCKELGKKNRGSVKFNIIHCQVLINMNDFEGAEIWLDESVKFNPYVLEYMQLGEVVYKNTGKIGKSKNSTSIMNDFEGNPINMDLVF
ncbi:MAG: tetratricopeptide (TPR) repeat protein [Halieaceae bacterium]|jgi:tetratricopeptide (TPR) repeat protein